MKFEHENISEQEVIRYSNPLENSEGRGGSPTHKLELSLKSGERIGWATFEYHNNPFPFYHVTLIFVDEKARGLGFGGEILEKINNYLDSNGKAGLLYNRIPVHNPARQMYEQHGWIPIPGRADWMSYNLPNEIDSGRIDKALHALE